jgi:hypothetical protein
LRGTSSSIPQYINSRPDAVIHTCNPNILEAETGGGSQVQGHPKLQGNTLSQKIPLVWEGIRILRIEEDGSTLHLFL